MLYSEKHPHEGKAQRQVYVEAHHEEVQDCELRGQGNFEWNTDPQKIENYTCQVYNGDGEAQHELGGVQQEQHCRSLRETSEWIENAVAHKETWTSNPGWHEW